ncbi:MAG: LCP family protein [Phototrophicaceae bacterium]|jgi:LCP family protein required for cell wall assembly
MDQKLKPTPTIPPPPGLKPVMTVPAKSGRRLKRSDWVLVILAAGFVGLIAVISAIAAVFVFIPLEPTAVALAPTAVFDLPTPVRVRQDYSGVDLSLVAGSRLVLENGQEIVIQPWDGESRFTVLLMGLDRRTGETGLQYRTDTIMLVSLDPSTNTVGILSIPRDLYVPVAGYAELQRINSPMVLGEVQRAGYGPTLAMETVQNNLGIRVNEFVAVDFNGFIKFIDYLGGIEITLNYTLNDPTYPNMYYGYDPFYLAPGTHLLNGDLALKFARTRHGSSDFQRAERQQQVLYAVREKLLQPGVLAQMIVQSPSLYTDFQQNVATGLTIDQMIQLLLFVKDVPRENITTGVIDQRYVSNYTTAAGAQVLVPNRALLGQLMTEVFGATYSQ